MLTLTNRAALIDHLKEAKLSSKDCCIHFFFNNNQKFTPTLNDLLRAMIKQALLRIEKDHGVLPHELKTKLFENFGTPTCSPPNNVLIALFENVIDRLPGTLYVIDGIEALAEDEILSIFGIIRTCFGQSKQHSSKLALFSREILGRGIDVCKQLPEIHYLRLGLNHLQKDIETFVDTQVELMQLKRVITQNAELLDEIRAKLKANSKKM